MPTIDLGPPRPTPHDLLDGLPRRVALTLPELRFAAVRANGAPLPFDLRDDDADEGGLDDRLGGSRGSAEQAAYAEARARLHDPATSLSRRGLLVGGPDDGVVEEGLLGAIGLLATPTVAVDLDIAAGPVQVKSWHRQSGGAVAALSTQDGLVFELASFPTWAWAAELARAAVVPEDLPLHDSVVPDLVTLPHELADAAIEAARTHRTDLVPVLVDQHPAAVTDGSGRTLTDSEVVQVLTGLATEARGRLRALVADVSGEETSTVGVVAWTLVADGWRALRAHHDDDGLRLEVARVIPDDLAAELAPVLAEVSMSARVMERSDKYDQLLQLADVFDRSGDELRAMSGLGAEVLRDDAVADSADLSVASHARAEEDIRAATTGKRGLLSRSIELDADALVVRATVLTYQWIDELRDAAYESMGAIAGRAIGFLAPNVALGGAIVTAGLIETDALDRDGVATFLSELAAANPELLDQVVSGGGGLLDGLQMRAALTSGFFSGESGRQAARGGLRAVGVGPMRQDSSAALRDVAGWLVAGPRPRVDEEPEVAAPHLPSSLTDLMATLELQGSRVLVHRTAPGRYVAYVGRPPVGPVPEDGPALRLVSGDLTPYAAEVAQTIAAAMAGEDGAHVMLVGSGAGGVVAAELAALEQPLPFVVDQVVTAGSPAAQVPRLPVETRMLALEDRADPVALLGSLMSAGDDQRTTIVFDAAGSSSEGVYVAGARVADASPDVVAELDRLRELGYLAPA